MIPVRKFFKINYITRQKWNFQKKIKKENCEEGSS
jgi:hypothetical protein